MARLLEPATDQRGDAERRLEIGGRIEQIAKIDKWGDLTQEAYGTERERIET